MNTIQLNLIGLITGIVFGFLLQRAQVIRFDRQIGALLFKDMTIVKFMLSAIFVGVIGIYLLKDFGVIKLAVKPMIIGGVVFGGLIFGIGWALLGYCPATAVAAVGEGRVDALWGVLGMVLGAGIFSHIYPWIKKVFLSWGDLGKITLPQILNINQWVIILGFIILGICLFVWFEKKKL